MHVYDVHIYTSSIPAMHADAVHGCVFVNEYLADVSNSLRKTLFHHLKGILCCETEKEYSQIIMYIQATNNYAGIDHIPESELSSKNLISSKRI